MVRPPAPPLCPLANLATPPLETKKAKLSSFGCPPGKTASKAFLLGSLLILSMALFPKITLSSINCNSLNISSMGSFNQKLKIYGIASLRTDIILMSDIRLCNAQGVSSSNEISQAFRINPYGSYTFLHNSHSNIRGVGILI